VGGALPPSSKAIFSGARQAIAAPLAAAALVTGAKSFEANPILGSRLLNERGLHAARVALSHRVAEARRARLAHLLGPADRASFARDGFILRENFLPQASFAALVAQVKAYRAPTREIVQGDTVNRKLVVDGAFLKAVPALAEVLTSADWRALLRYVGAVDADPAVYIQTLLRHARAGPADPQTAFHADTFHPNVKAWLFLTDVAAEGGPFVYVPGSHRLTPERLAWEQQKSVTARYAADSDTRQGSFRIDTHELGALGLPPPHVFAVPANSLVVADTFGFHARGPSRDPSLRVEVFALGKRRPFMPWRGYDPITTAARGNAAALLWRMKKIFGACDKNLSAFDGG